MYNDNQYKFEIQGTMDNKNFNYNNLVLTVNIDDKKEEIINVTCTSQKLKEQNYTLSCTSSKVVKGNLNSAFSNLGNDNLVVHFEEKKISQFYHLSTKQKKKVNAGIIAAIIICFLVVIILIILLLLWLKRKKKKEEQKEDSTLHYMNKELNKKIDEIK